MTKFKKDDDIIFVRVGHPCDGKRGYVLEGNGPIYSVFVGGRVISVTKKNLRKG